MADPADTTEAEAKALERLTKAELIEMIVDLRRSFDAQLVELRAAHATDTPEELAAASSTGEMLGFDLDDVAVELDRIGDALVDANTLKRAELTLDQLRQGHYPYANDARYREAAHAVIGDLRATEG